ncbi:MAG: endopeptidase La [Clostridia bacterium]|nr:endopeptidase La [Clostridia bacterium]
MTPYIFGVDFLNRLNDYKVMPTVALRGLVIFPGMTLNFDVGRQRSIDAIKAAMADTREVFLVAQKDVRDDEPEFDQIFKMGTVARISHILKMPNSDTIRISVEGLYRAALVDMLQTQPYLIADVKMRKSTAIKAEDKDYEIALVRQTKDFFEDYADVAPQMPGDLILEVLEKNSAGELADYIAGNIMLEYKKRQTILNEVNPLRRLEKVCCLLAKEGDLMRLENDINRKVQENIDKSQREYYLHEQMRVISDELNDGLSLLDECEDFREKIKALALDEESEKKLLKECARLERMAPTSPEATVSRVYIETCIDLPWNKLTQDNLNIANAKKVLDRDHYGMEKVKERIVEALAVRKLSDGGYGQTLCFVGPPGVGKTSIAKSVAEAMGRKFSRVSLGGVHDEAEIRGHRKTYIGSMPGRIISAVKSAGTRNPIILLDEIDKLGSDYKGDPSSALLEVLDGEQNATFTDHYIDMPFDLSKVMFITTANDKSTIPAPLLDRMEVIELPSYTHEEKFNIAKKHLVPKQVKLHGLDAKTFKINDKALRDVIDGYTREAGVRRLEQQIAALCRKGAAAIVSGEEKAVSVKVTSLEKMLGPKKYMPETIDEDYAVGVVNGLAWTSVGGEMLQVEVAVLDGTGKVELTGSLGDVMKESAMAAISFIRSRAEKYGINPNFYKEKDIHIHVPEGAVPKDGPSAGVTMATALLSALTDTPVDSYTAMTGEISLRGRVMPIGGLREKTMAAYRMGIRKVIIPKKNVPDLAEVDLKVKNSIEFVSAASLDDVFENALVKKNDGKKAVAAMATEKKVGYNIMRT